MKITDLKPEEYSEFYQNYINLISKNKDLKDAFKDDTAEVNRFFKSLPAVKLNYAYANAKWSVKEVFQHLIDTERVFQYRCFRIARRDTTALAGFEQNDYIDPSRANEKALETLLDEFTVVRQSFISLLGSLTQEDLKFIGNANNSSMSARAAAFIVLGHYKWHMEIIKQRYL
ncbi:DinB family protein [Gaetbulibacter saemankumensis]|uniref:DinB family protein n=1 Tax=Gaetbulibacter saemankumensis TaxID=311208 RepID=UPI0004195DB0|nr:DinB family protein [Gaetbulibacter saemankumensis]